MLSDELFEKVSEFLQIMKRNKKPFGGVQLILVGDPFQLCPVEGCEVFVTRDENELLKHLNAGPIVSRVHCGKSVTFEFIALKRT